MLFWSFVMLVVIGIICFIIYENTMADKWIFDIGVIFEIFGWLVFLVSLVIGFVTSV